MAPAIRVDNLSKSYTISHERRERYVALRDVLASKLRALGRGGKRLFSGDLSKGTDETSEEFWALKDVSFEIQAGERVGVIGRNGAGKSTLLKVLSRITEPTRGRVEIAGRVASLLEVGTGFHPELTGRENIFLNGAILGMTKRELMRKFDAIVDFAEVEKFLDTPVKRYSSGMYVRLAFAVAAYIEPEILIIDEVLAVGDVQFQKKCLGKMEEIGSNGRTVVFVSHNMAAITGLCARAIWLSEGQVRMTGEVEQVTSQYLLDGAEESGEVSLATRAQDSRFGFTYLRLMNQAQVVSSSFDVRDPILVEIGYRSHEMVRNLELTMRVYNFAGTPIFSTNRSSSRSTPLSIGTFSCLLEIPSRFLSPGGYTIDVGAHIPNIEVLSHLQSIATFIVEETGSEMSGYAGQGHGVVLLNIEWRETTV